MTVDVDIVHERTGENIDALLAVLVALDAHFRGHSEKRLEPTREHLESAGHQLLMTSYGPLDLLGAIENGLTYEQLLVDSIEIEFHGHMLKVLSLEKYVELKEQSAYSKDRARLPVLRETLKMNRNPDESDDS